MIRLNKIVLVVAFAVLIHQTGVGQDPQFSQFYAVPMYLNPALTGNTLQGRVAANYRKQWLEVPGAFTSYTFSYDQYIRKYKSGVGLMFVRDKAGSGALRYNSIGGLYSYVFNITRSIGVRVGMRGSYTSRSIDFFRLKFADQIIRNDPYQSIESFNRIGTTYFDFGTGAIIYGSDFWSGFSLDHLNSPNESFLKQNSRVPIKYSLQGGYRIVLTENAKGNPEQDITAVAIYKGQQDWDQIDIGAYYKYKVVLAGVWYRGIPGLKGYKAGYPNNDALIIMLGAQLKDFFHIGYSYDVTISKLGLASKGSHEMSIIYEFAQPEYKRTQKKQNFIVPCTKF